MFDYSTAAFTPIAILARHLISRRTLLQTALGAAALPRSIWGQTDTSQTLPNGIVLGRPWPPRWIYPNEHPATPPYLTSPPRVIPIDVGRQLFVDDFLIAESTLQRTFHRANYHAANPILRPERPWELLDDTADRTAATRNPAAMVFSDGVFFDPQDRTFKMWYMGGYGRSTCLALSHDGITWTKPAFDIVRGTNIVMLQHRDSTTVWLDLWERDPRTRYKMSSWRDHQLTLLTSADGIHWQERGQTGRTGDRSTFFYNPFRKVWVFSLRADQFGAPVTGRYRRYRESARFDASTWDQSPSVAWIKADSRDYSLPSVNTAPELYNLDCVAYESVMLGLFSIWRGEPGVREKVNEVTLGFSRDGFHWQRGSRDAFLPVSDQPGAWNWANVQSAGGGCLIVGDRLFFYCSGRQGRPGTADPGVCTTGLATLRRDGFASMDWLPGETVTRQDASAGYLVTRPITFNGQYLFVNADTAGGELRVELLDGDGRVVQPFSTARCEPFRGNGTRVLIRWTTDSLAEVAGRVVRFRFTMTRGRLYSFWVSPWRTGESRGYPAAGGPEFSSGIDAPAER
jgi:hypothetical protein